MTTTRTTIAAATLLGIVALGLTGCGGPTSDGDTCIAYSAAVGRAAQQQVIDEAAPDWARDAASQLFNARGAEMRTAVRKFSVQCGPFIDNN